MLTTWPRLAVRLVITPVIGAGTVTSETIWLGLVSASTCRPAQPQEEEPLASGLDLRGMAGMDRGDVFEFLTARRPDGDELLHALQLLVIGDEHGTHGEIFRLGLRQFRTEQRRQRSAALDGGPQLDVDLGDNAPDNGDDFHLPVGVGHHRPRELNGCLGCGHLRRCGLDPGPAHGLGRQHDLGRARRSARCGRLRCRRCRHRRDRGSRD